MSEPVTAVREGMLVRHYKGAVYVVVGTARLTDGDSELVVYRAVATGALWARPVAEFLGAAGDGVPRFREVV